MNLEILPKWAREIIRFFSVKPQFMVWGNIYDVYPIELEGNITTLRMTDYLRHLLKENAYGLILTYEPLTGFTLIEGLPETFKEVTGETISKEKPLSCTLNKGMEIMEKLVGSQKVWSAVILCFSSRIPEISGNDMHEFYYRMFRLAQSAVPKMTASAEFPRFNLILWILDKENDLPAWYTLDNPKVKNLAVPKPDYVIRKTVIENLSKHVAGFVELDENKRKDNITMFIDQTGGLHASEIISIVTLARREKIAFTEISEAIRMYKLGIIENPWSRLDTQKIAAANSILEKRVKGQSRAIRKASDIIKRAVYNLSGAQYSKFSQRPKGVLFLAGPTGVGKTELAKSITELVFGSETSYIRFDMSEFSHEHSDQRLVGAPPGYVGYDVGGQLTNAIKQNPFSLVLFDEVEKAHPKILDIFLQILDDGRLTSGRGETVYFSESLIVFTSNLGIYELTPDGKKIQRVNPEMPYEDINGTILQSIEEFFKYRINRPEILNRIGDNIVVFDFIRQEVAGQIFDKMLRNVTEKLVDSHNITIEMTGDFLNKIGTVCFSDLSMGGRGIGNKLEDAFVNPLSRALFGQQTEKGDIILIKDMVKKGEQWELLVQKKST